MISQRIGNHIRSNVVAYLALFIALGGGAYASHLVVRSSDIVDDAVRAGHIADDAVRPPHIDAQAVGTSEVRNDNLTATDLATGAVGFDELSAEGFATGDIDPQGSPQAYGISPDAVQGSEVSANTLTGADIDEFGLSVDSMGCKPGLVLGFARIKGDPDMPSTPTSSSTWIDEDRTCRALSGYQVTVQRTGVGTYIADFWPPGFPIPISLAVASSDAAGGSACVDNLVSVTSGLGEGRVAVHSFDDDGDAQDCWVTLVVF